jgi:putative transposase
MRNALRRHYGRGDLHFITFSCYRRRPLLGSCRARDRFLKILDEVRSTYEFLLVGYVVMPEHVHLLMSEPAKGDPSKALQVLKQKTSRALRRKTRKNLPGQLSLKFGSAETDARAFWQRRFYDFNVWSGKKLKEKLDYMHANPVKRKLVGHPKDWPWSSWGFYTKGEEGLIRVEPVGCGNRNGNREEERSKPAPLKPKGAAPARTHHSGYGLRKYPALASSCPCRYRSAPADSQDKSTLLALL